ncbi:hypothetical protein [Clostridium sp.]|uniref:hypothetical protein n=1 Tax=Clostridium sp. TaxID=1506 RepID=UPI0028453019|nr:hypothetical protein [Clostridium sp.]MDR3596869.1 hypothetical protein [Clostridium sp.]
MKTRITKKTKSKSTLRRNDYKQNVIEFWIEEYKKLFEENGKIIDKRIKIYKIITALVIALIGYVISGLIFYINSRGTTPVPIPESLAFGYSLLGAILTLAVYTFVHNAFFYLGPSKKHTVRNWQAIHAIRAGFKSLDEDLSKYIIMPDSINHSDRPRLSSRWELGAFIYPIYHLIFYLILSLLLVPFFSPNNAVIGLKIDISKLDAFTSSMFLLLPGIVIKLVTGGKAMRDYIANIIEAREIGTSHNIFPSARDASATKTPAWLWYYNIILVLGTLSIWTDHFIIKCLPLLNNSYFSIRFILITIFLSLLGEVSYLLLVGVLGFSIKVEKGTVKFNIKRIGKFE